MIAVGEGRRFDRARGRAAGVAVVAVAGLVAIVVWVVFSTDDPPPPRPAAEASAPAPGTGPAAGGAAGPVETAELFASKDPFGPVTGAGAAGGAAAGGAGHSVVLLDTSPGRARVGIGGEQFSVDEGETFARYFMLLEADARCAVLLFGDDQFSICGDQELRK